MIGTRYENYSEGNSELPFILNNDLIRTPLNFSKEYNWHEDLELQICLDGQGWVLLNGEKYEFKKDDVAVVCSDVIHYTGSDKEIKYTCIIVRSGFIKNLGMDFNNVSFNPIIKNDKLKSLMIELQNVYLGKDYHCRIALLNKLLIEILIELIISHATTKKEDKTTLSKSHDIVKRAIKHIRENFAFKLSLDEIARVTFTNKFALSREFKKLTGQTVVEYINRFRMLKAIEYLKEGTPVGITASECGFDSCSFFTKTFKKYIGKKPSEIE